MWHLIPTILYLTYGEAQPPRPGNYPILMNNERAKPAPYYNPGLTVPTTYNVPARQYPDYTAVTNPLTYPYPQRLPQYVDDPYYNGPPNYNKIPPIYSYFSPNGNNLRQSKSPSQPRVAGFGSEPYPFDLDYGSSDITDTDPKTFVDGQSYFEDLELVENFGNYLKRRTLLDGSSAAINDAAHQYNALLAVLVALARVVRNSCTDFDQVYDQVYLSTVDTYYKYGLANAEKIAVMIDDYIKKGNSHIPKLKKLKQELCEKELFCSVGLDNKIKSSPLSYVKELETLEALAHLARSYYPYIEEFNQAAQKGNVLHYLQNSKDRLREYVMHIVNSVEHLSDKSVRCP